MTRRQSNNQWSGDIAAHLAPNTPSAKIRWERSGLGFIRSRKHPPNSLSYKGPNYELGVLPISTGAIEGHFEGKTPRKHHKGGLALVRQYPVSRALATQIKLAYPGFQCLDHPPNSPDLAPSNYHLFPGLKKTIESSLFFVRRGGHFCRGDLVGRTTL